MSAITCIQSKGNYHFSIEKPTQNQKSIAVQQTSKGLKIFVKDDLKTVKVERSLVDGLPKMDFVPKEFFDSCYATLKTIDGEAKVTFHASLKGGGLNELIDSLRQNLYNDCEYLSDDDVDILLNVFKQLVEKKESGADQNQISEFVRSELCNYENKEELQKGFNFILTRAEGKYGGFGISFMGVKLNFSW